MWVCRWFCSSSYNGWGWDCVWAVKGPGRSPHYSTFNKELLQTKWVCNQCYFEESTHRVYQQANTPLLSSSSLQPFIGPLLLLNHLVLATRVASSPLNAVFIIPSSPQIISLWLSSLFSFFQSLIVVFCHWFCHQLDILSFSAPLLFHPLLSSSLSSLLFLSLPV